MAIAEWDYNEDHYVKDVLKYLDNEIQQGRFTENQATSIAGGILELKERFREKGNSEVVGMAEQLAEAIRRMGEQATGGRISVGERLGVSNVIGAKGGALAEHRRGCSIAQPP